MFKLVRDKIPEVIQSTGQKCNYAEVKNNEFFIELLRAKLIEEVNEFWAANNLEELADIKLVVETLAEALGYTKEQLDEAYSLKLEERGKFDNKYIIFLPDAPKAPQSTEE
jgi:predicted house-cleaning noncanonical NTP pyrophosphatase (MazG superfamily)